MNVLVISTLAVAALVGRVACDDKVTIALPTPTVGGCPYRKPRTTSVRLQSFLLDSVEYTRVRVPSGRMNFLDVKVTNLKAASFVDCAVAARSGGYEVFSYVDDMCKGYAVKDGICPCTTGDFVIYRTKNAVRDPSSVMVSTVSTKSEDGTALPAGYVRKIIYPSVSFPGTRFKILGGSCAEFLQSGANLHRPMILFNENGKCYFSEAYQGGECNSCAGPAVEVIVYTEKESPAFFIPHCNVTITARQEYERHPYPYSFDIFSHEGYGCIPYPDPPTDDDCFVTVEKPTGMTAVSYYVYDELLNLDISEGASSCDGDELYIYEGKISSDVGCVRITDPPYKTGNAANIIIKFQRRPAHGPGSKNEGFAVGVYSQ